MLIRSQDKLQLIPLEIGYVSINYSDKKNLIFCGTVGEENYTAIGRYSTEAKAIKVLDMIQGYHSELENNRINFQGYMQPTFRMPSDEEVEV